MSDNIDTKDMVIGDVDVLQSMRRRWTVLMQKEDGGSYCENASPKYIAAHSVRNAITKALEAAEKYEREYL